MRAFLLFGEQSQRMEPTPIQLYIIGEQPNESVSPFR